MLLRLSGNSSQSRRIIIRNSNVLTGDDRLTISFTRDYFDREIFTLFKFECKNSSKNDHSRYESFGG